MKKLTMKEIQRICKTFNSCKSWKKTAEIEGVSAEWISVIKKKYIVMKAEPKTPKFSFTSEGK